MSWKVWKWDGRYIQGELISSHTTEAAALKKAKKEIKYLKAVKSEIDRKDEIVIWLAAFAVKPNDDLIFSADFRFYRFEIFYLFLCPLKSRCFSGVTTN